MNRKGLLGLAFASICAAANAVAANNIELISAPDYGDAWPFKAEEMHLLCLPGNAVVVSDPESGVMYPVNGAAKSQANRLALEPLEKIWRDDPEIAGVKVSIGPITERGLKLCAG